MGGHWIIQYSLFVGVVTGKQHINKMGSLLLQTAH
jgi:hypothetical protein